MEKSRSFPQYSADLDFQDRSNTYNFNGPSTKGDGFAPSNHPEMKRKKRIASYNTFTTEGKVKATVRESFKWIKTKLNDIRYGL